MSTEGRTYSWAYRLLDKMWDNSAYCDSNTMFYSHFKVHMWPLHEIFSLMTVVTVILSNKKPVAYFSRQCNCLISLGGSKVKRENLSNRQIDESSSCSWRSSGLWDDCWWVWESFVLVEIIWISFQTAAARTDALILYTFFLKIHSNPEICGGAIHFQSQTILGMSPINFTQEKGISVPERAEGKESLPEGEKRKVIPRH